MSSSLLLTKLNLLLLLLKLAFILLNRAFNKAHLWQPRAKDVQHTPPSGGPIQTLPHPYARCHSPPRSTCVQTEPAGHPWQSHPQTLPCVHPLPTDVARLSATHLLVASGEEPGQQVTHGNPFPSQTLPCIHPLPSTHIVKPCCTHLLVVPVEELSQQVTHGGQHTRRHCGVPWALEALGGRLKVDAKVGG